MENLLSCFFELLKFLFRFWVKVEGGEGEVAKRLIEAQAVVRRLRLGERGEAPLLGRPVEGARIDHAAA